MIFTKAKVFLLALLVFVFSISLVFGRTPQTVPVKPAPHLTILYDNYDFAPGCKADWGFSALIEGLEKTILFDTGTSQDIFANNAEVLKANLLGVDFVVISHDHGDHTGGLPVFLRAKPGVTVYAPAGSNQAFLSSVTKNGGKLITVKEPLTFFPGVFSTGEMGQAIHEQAIVIDSPKGLIVITGCAHPGIVSIVEKAKEVGKKDIWMVLGGFHLVQTPPADVDKIIARFKELGVQRVGATHCTGDAAIAQFRKAFGAGFVEMGVGRKIALF